MSERYSILKDPYRVIHVAAGDPPIADHKRRHICVMGNLDGVHLGHQALIDQAIYAGHGNNTPVGAIVFAPHPRQMFLNDTAPFLLTTLERKAELLIQCGVETVYVLNFNEALASLSPEAFYIDILLNQIGVDGIVVGAEFQFGKGRTGNAETLQKLGSDQNVQTHILRPIINEGAADKYSSSQARQAIRDGDPQTALKVLGRPWSVRGTVEQGKRLGRTLNFPTANISLGPLLPPKLGVYAVTVLHKDMYYKGVANFGERPTVGGEGLLLEVHIFDFNETIYDSEIDVDFYHFIRGEQKFDGLEALQAQITQDCKTARQLLDF